MNGHRLIILLLLLGLLAPAALAAVRQVDMADTRVLIDISGSMKKNDPDNLRRPALRLLVGLLPADSRAGVWTFGQYVNMEVPLGKVDPAWKRRAMKGAGRIHSRGLFTNIEEAIKRSTADWEGASVQYRRHLVLLTDGMVDVSKDPAASAASRRRILEQWLPRLKAWGARIHTIALSERADHELMQTLSRETGGWYEQVADAAQLQRVFLRIFEKVGQPDSVPLKDNRFRIDASIEEATLLVFRADDAPPTRVVTPDGTAFGAEDAPAGVSWHRDAGYDLLTIKKPQTGEWRIQAAVDPDNRVLVVTDLKLRTSELPNRWVQGEPMPLSAWFSDGEKQIRKPEFLSVVELQAEPKDANGPGEPRPLRDEGRDGDAEAGDGRFTLLLGQGMAPGRGELTLLARGKTFQRSRHFTFEQVAPATLTVSREEGIVTVRLTPAAEVLEPDSVEIQARLVATDGEERPVMLLPAVDGAWETRIDTAGLAGQWRLAVHVAARTRNGNPVALDLDPVAVEGSAEAPPPPAKPAPVVEEEAPPEESAEESDWTSMAMLFGGINLLLILLGGGLFWWLRRRRRRGEVRLLDEEDEGAAAEEPAGDEAAAVKELDDAA